MMSSFEVIAWPFIKISTIYHPRSPAVTSLPKHGLCLYSADVLLVFQGEVCCGQKVCGEMHRPWVCRKVHEEETEGPRLSDGDHPWDCSTRVGHSQPPGGQPPPGLWDGFWDGAGPGVVSIQAANDTKTLNKSQKYEHLPMRCPLSGIKGQHGGQKRLTHCMNINGRLCRVRSMWTWCSLLLLAMTLWYGGRLVWFYSRHSV